MLDDSVSTPRGLSVKIIGVEGERLPGSEEDVTQDFLLVNGPSFGAPNPKAFLSVLKLLAKTTDRAEGLKKILSAVMRQVQKVIVATTGQPNVTVATLGGQPETNILGETFYSQAPLRFGDFIAKISVAPTSPELVALVQAPLNVNGVPDGLREAVVDFFRKNSGVWEVRAQLCTDLELMPIENAAIVWPEDISPYRAVAGLPCSRNWRGAKRDRQPLTTACRSRPGMDWPHTVRWVASCGSARSSTRWRGSSGPKPIAA
jgi:hypothetical protein